MGADLFSNGSSDLNSAIFVRWCTFIALCLLWRWPAVAVLASVFNFVMRTFWVWPGPFKGGILTVLFVQGLDLLIIAAAVVALRLRNRSRASANREEASFHVQPDP